ncbi:hypothetical protein NDU88_009890 [Pleurodeles waltl]|uniref:Uncharacterized protein n=1 Tax=Pleurodeles waltl TaxID=8319 RepID=A0AAV7S1P7_PLEWA|nr:hypothetical protein NDU88_009890 [Pleurodeles waltl]
MAALQPNLQRDPATKKPQPGAVNRAPPAKLQAGPLREKTTPRGCSRFPGTSRVVGQDRLQGIPKMVATLGVKSLHAVREVTCLGWRRQDPSTGSVGGWGQPATGRREVAGAP